MRAGVLVVLVVAASCGDPDPPRPSRRAASVPADARAKPAGGTIACDALLDTGELRACGRAVRVTQPDRLVGKTCLVNYTIDGRVLALSVFLDEPPGHHLLEDKALAPPVEQGGIATFDAKTAGETVQVAESTLGRATVTVYQFATEPACATRMLGPLVTLATARLPEDQADLGRGSAQAAVVQASTGTEVDHGKLPACPTLVSAKDIATACHLKGVTAIPNMPPGCYFTLPGDVQLSMRVLVDSGLDAAKAAFAQPMRAPYRIDDSREVAGVGNQARLGTIFDPDPQETGDRVLLVRDGNVTFNVGLGKAGASFPCSDDAAVQIARGFIAHLPRAK